MTGKEMDYDELMCDDLADWLQITLLSNWQKYIHDIHRNLTRCKEDNNMNNKTKRLIEDIHKLSYPEEIKRFLPINHNDEIIKFIDWSYDDPDDYNTEYNRFCELMDTYEADLDKLSPAMLIVISMICDNLSVLHPECYNERYMGGGCDVDLPYFKMFHDEVKWEINKRFLLHLSEMLDMNSQMLYICQSPKNRKELRQSIKKYKEEIIKCREDNAGNYGYNAYRRLYNNIIN